MSLPLIGEGHVRYQGEQLTGAQGLRIAGLTGYARPKEGLALLNGTQASTALALSGLFQSENLMIAATLSGAMSVERQWGTPPLMSAFMLPVGNRGKSMPCFRELLRDDSAIGKSIAHAKKYRIRIRCAVSRR